VLDELKGHLVVAASNHPSCPQMRVVLRQHSSSRICCVVQRQNIFSAIFSIGPCCQFIKRASAVQHIRDAIRQTNRASSCRPTITVQQRPPIITRGSKWSDRADLITHLAASILRHQSAHRESCEMCAVAIDVVDIRHLAVCTPNRRMIGSGNPNTSRFLWVYDDEAVGITDCAQVRAFVLSVGGHCETVCIKEKRA